MGENLLFFMENSIIQIYLPLLSAFISGLPADTMEWGKM
jgi:hypothetical protein